MLYLNRRVPKSEIAFRISNMDNKHLRQVCNKWLRHAHPSITNWGPAKAIEESGMYKFYKVDSVKNISNTLKKS
jgi:hypothetical protein